MLLVNSSVAPRDGAYQDKTKMVNPTTDVYNNDLHTHLHKNVLSVSASHLKGLVVTL